MPRSSNSDSYMDYYSAGGPAGNSVDQGGLGGSRGPSGPSSSSRGSSGSDSTYGDVDAGGRSITDAFSGTGTSFADSGSTYGDINAGGISSGSPSGRSAPSDAGMDNYFGGSPNRGTDNMGGVSSIGGGLSSRSSRGLGVPGLSDTIGGGLNPGSRSTYGRSEAGGLAVSNTVGRGLGRGLGSAYEQKGRSLEASGIRNLSAPGKLNVATTMPREMAALLAAIAIPESRQRWGAKYRDKEITDFRDHPRTYREIASGPNKGKKSSASGAFQFIVDTFDRLASAVRAQDFSPRSQTAAAMALAKETYSRLGKNYKSLEEALEARDFDDITRAMSDQWEGVRNTRSGRAQFARDFERELAKLEEQDIRTDATVTAPGQVFTNPDGSKVATPANAIFTTEKQTPTTSFVAEVLGYLDPQAHSKARAAPEVNAPAIGTTATDEYPTPFNTERSGFNVEHDLELRTAPTNVELEDLPGNEHLLAPSTPPRGLGPSSEPKEATFEETYLGPTKAAPATVPTLQQRGDTTIRDVVPADWQRPTGDRWAGVREGDVGFGDYGPGDPWTNLRDATDAQPGSEAERRLKSIGGRLLSGTIDAGLAMLPGIGVVNLATKMTSGKTIGEAIASGAFDEVSDWSNQIEGEGTNPAFGETAAVTQDEEPDDGDASADDFVATYLLGQSNPTPAMRWGRR